MSETLILPGTYIKVNAEGLIAPGQVTLGNIGIVGTAAKGPVGTPVLLGSNDDAVRVFGAYDSWIDPATLKKRDNELTLSRAAELAFAFGATTVYGVRVAVRAPPGAAPGTAPGAAQSASYTVLAATSPTTTGPGVTLTALSPGKWADDGLTINVAAATADTYVQSEMLKGSATPLTLKHVPKPSARNRAFWHVDATRTTHTLEIVYPGGAAPTPGQVELDTGTGVLTFGDSVALADVVEISYVVDATRAAQVTLKLGNLQETYTVIDGNDLVGQINDPNTGSAFVTAAAAADAADLPKAFPVVAGQLPLFARFGGGANGEAAALADYNGGFDTLLPAPVQIVVAAGQYEKAGDPKSYGNALNRHCQNASTDAIKGERIGIIGPPLANPNDLEGYFDELIGHDLDSDRIILIAPGIAAADSAAGTEVTLSGAYAAAAYAGLLSTFSAEVSSTNKVLSVDDIEIHWDNAHLTQLVVNRVMALESRQGFHIVKGITTAAADLAPWRQITTRRIVDYAKYGVRLAADPYIGLLNDERVRGALRATLASFLADMVNSEMLETYDLDVSATRAEEIAGIVNVTMVLQPVFSIDYIKVTMNLQ